MPGLNKTLLLLFLLSPLAQAAPRRFLHGRIESTAITGSKVKGGGISDMIRLKFDADTVEYCEKMVSSYCRYNILDKQYKPKAIEAYFKDDAKPKGNVDFVIDEKCKVRRSTDNDD